jgi:hypothetical protein
MNLNYRTFIGLFFFLLCGLFSVNAFADSDCATVMQSCNTYVSSAGTGQTCVQHSDGIYTEYPPSYNAPTYLYATCNSSTPPCPSAGTPYTGYYPSGGAATDTVYAPNGTSATCAVAIDNMKTSCPPNTVMPTFGTVETPACIVVGIYTGTAGPSGVQSNAANPPSSPSDCPAGSAPYSISNGTKTTSGCAASSPATSSNPSAPPASTTSTGSNSTNTTTTTN